VQLNDIDAAAAYTLIDPEQHEVSLNASAAGKGQAHKSGRSQSEEDAAQP